MPRRIQHLRQNQHPLHVSQDYKNTLPGSHVLNPILLDSPPTTSAFTNTGLRQRAAPSFSQATSRPSHDTASNFRASVLLSDTLPNFARQSQQKQVNDDAKREEESVKPLRGKARHGAENDDNVEGSPQIIEDHSRLLNTDLPSLVYLDYYQGNIPSYGDPALAVFDNPPLFEVISHNEFVAGNTFGYTEQSSLQEIYESRSKCG